MNSLVPVANQNALVAQTPFVMTPFAEMERMAKQICSSGMFGKMTEPQALTLMMLAQSEGLHPIDGVRRYHIIEGRPSMRADAMLAEFQRRGGTIQYGRRDDQCVSAVMAHPAGGSLEIVWDMARAAKAGLSGKQQWQKHPCQMLTARVISEGVRSLLPGVAVGIYTPEETMIFNATASDNTILTEQVIEGEAVVQPMPSTPLTPSPSDGRGGAPTPAPHEAKSPLYAPQKTPLELAKIRYSKTANQMGHDVLTLGKIDYDKLDTLFLNQTRKNPATATEDEWAHAMQVLQHYKPAPVAEEPTPAPVVTAPPTQPGGVYKNNFPQPVTPSPEALADRSSIKPLTSPQEDDFDGFDDPFADDAPKHKSPYAGSGTEKGAA